MPQEPHNKNHVSIYLHDVHLGLLDELVPFYGGSRAEVIRYIVVNWLSENAGSAKRKKRRRSK